MNQNTDLKASKFVRIQQGGGDGIILEVPGWARRTLMESVDEVDGRAAAPTAEEAEAAGAVRAARAVGMIEATLGGNGANNPCKWENGITGGARGG